MIEIKEAISKARDYAHFILGADPDEMLVEEISRAGDDYWDITMSFWARIPKKLPLMPSLSMAYQHALHQGKSDVREMKTFRVNKATGEVESMRNVPANA